MSFGFISMSCSSSASSIIERMNAFFNHKVQKLSKDSSSGGKISIRSMEVVNLKKGNEK